ncbi:MAG TPA: TonB-dependent receptor [Puia sp.]|nr:TonB-dependent receptor [Puia sp.]
MELAGSSSIRFLINGKPSSAFGSNIADVLQSIPASQIKSIEVITNPGAKYDAEGLGGIINIILKSTKANGINGSMSLSAGTRMENGSFNFNARHGNFGVNAFLSGNYRLLAATPSSSDRLASDTGQKTNTRLLQDGEYQFKRHGYQTGIGFDWTVKKYNSFSGSLNYNNFGNNGTGLIEQSQTMNGQAGNTISEIQSLNHSNNTFLFHSIDASLGYKRTFAREDQELEISANSSFGNNHIDANSYQVQQPQDSIFYGTNSTNPGKENETEIKLDYTQPLKKGVLLGVGGKLSLRDINSRSDVLSYQPAMGTYVFNNALSNSLSYHQQVYAGYAEMSFPVAKLFNAKIGGRYERTEINSFYSNAQQQVNAPGYNTFVPSIFFIRKIGENQTVKISYSKRIERPDYRDLNPFINTIDPKNVTAGNPYLKPEIGNRIELSYSREFDKTGSIMVTAFYRANDHDIQPYIVYYPTLVVGDSTYTNIAVSTNQNIGLEKNMGLSLFADIHPGSKFGIRTNVFVFERHTINAIDAGYNSNSFNYRININLSYQFPKNFAGEFFGNFNSPRNEAQGRYPSFTSYSFAFRKQIWNKKGSIALTATNPFGEYVDQKTEVFGPNFRTNSLRRVPFRSIGINFTWKFGKLQFKKEKEEGNDNSTAAPEG